MSCPISFPILITFDNPQQAKQFVWSNLHEQATREGISLGDFEQRLMKGLASDDEIESFEESNDGDDADSFSEKVCGLARRALKGERATDLRMAMRVAASDPGYLEEILIAEGVLRPKPGVGKRIRHVLVLGVVCVVGGLALAFIAPWLYGVVEKIGNSHGAKDVPRFLGRYGLGLSVVVLVTGLIMSLRQLLR